MYEPLPTSFGLSKFDWSLQIFRVVGENGMNVYSSHMYVIVQVITRNEAIILTFLDRCETKTNQICIRNLCGEYNINGQDLVFLCQLVIHEMLPFVSHSSKQLIARNCSLCQAFAQLRLYFTKGHLIFLCNWASKKNSVRWLDAFSYSYGTTSRWGSSSSVIFGGGWC